MPAGSTYSVLSSPSSAAFSFIRRDEAFSAQRRRARQHTRRGVVGADQQQVQQVVLGHAVAGTDVGGGRAIDVGPLDHDLRVEVGRVLQHDRRRHHLRDAGNRSLDLRVLLPQHLSGARVIDDGGFGADVGHQRAGFVELEMRLLGLADAPWRWPRRGRGPGWPAGCAPWWRAPSTRSAGTSWSSASAASPEWPLPGPVPSTRPARPRDKTPLRASDGGHWSVSQAASQGKSPANV